MSTRAIQGKNVNVSLQIEGVMLPWVCATNCSVDFTTELIRRTSVGSGNHAKYKPRMMDATAELTGITHILPLENRWTVFDVVKEAVRMQGANIQIDFEDGDGNTKSITGYVLFPSISISAGADGFSEDTIQMQFSGVPGVFNEPPSPIQTLRLVKWDIHDGTDGEQGFTDARMIGADASDLAVFRGGGFLDVITSGTPGIQQVRFNSSTGQLFFSPALGPGERIWYQWQVPSILTLPII